MSRFENKLCPVCRERFRDGDDIAVCPECGTPHHRSCYLRHNKCGLEELHAQGFVWKGRLPDEPEPAVTIPTAQERLSAVPEPLDRRMNNLEDSGEASAAEQSSAEDPEKPEDPDDRDRKTIEILGLPDPDDEMFGNTGMSDPIKDLYNMVNDDAVGEDGVSMRELIAYTGTSIWHYGRAFRTFRNGEGGRKRVTSFNLCSGLFTPIFQFYRKMDVLGIILLIISALPTVLLLTLWGKESFTVMFGLLRLLNVAEMVLLCLFGDYLFYRRAVRGILRVRRNFDGDTSSVEYLKALFERGRPSYIHAILGCLGMLFANACIYAAGGGLV